MLKFKTIFFKKETFKDAVENAFMEGCEWEKLDKNLNM